MKKIIVLLAAVLMVLGLSSGIAHAGLDFTLEFVRDFDAEASSSEVELATGSGILDCSLTWTRDWVPKDDVVEIDVGVTLADTLRVGFDRELTLVDSGTLTATLDIAPITLEYARELEAGVWGSLTITLEGSV